VDQAGTIDFRLTLCFYGCRIVSTIVDDLFHRLFRGAVMKSLICGASMLSLLVVIGIVGRNVGAADDAPASIDKIMQTLHKGKKSAMATLKTQLKSQSPDWSIVQKETKTYAKFAADLPKNDPPKGDAASFKKLAQAFASNAKTLDDSAKKENLAATNAALKKINGSCQSCHEAHRED
jgi:cytochrome c556